MKQMKDSPAARPVFDQPRRVWPASVRVVSLLASAALAGGAAYSYSGGTFAQAFGTTANQNELPGPVKEITVEMHEGTNMAAFPSPDGSKMVLSLQGGL